MCKEPRNTGHLLKALGVSVSGCRPWLVCPMRLRGTITCSVSHAVTRRCEPICCLFNARQDDYRITSKVVAFIRTGSASYRRFVPDQHRVDPKPHIPAAISFRLQLEPHQAAPTPAPAPSPPLEPSNNIRYNARVESMTSGGWDSPVKYTRQRGMLMGLSSPVILPLTDHNPRSSKLAD